MLRARFSDRSTTSRVAAYAGEITESGDELGKRALVDGEGPRKTNPSLPR